MAEEFNIEEAYQALEQAHKQGKTAEAKKIAQRIQSESRKMESSGEVQSLDVVGEKTVADKVSSWFKPKDAKKVSAEEAAGALGGGAATGAAFNVAAPYLMQAAGKVIPGPIGKAIGAAGEAYKLVPTSERALSGAGAGVGMGTAGVVGDLTGAPPALTFAGELAAGGLGSAAGTLAQRGLSPLLRAGGQAAAGNAGGALRAASTITSPNKTANEIMAQRAQELKFGKALPEFSSKLETTAAREQAQKQIRMTDPEFFNGKDAARSASSLYREELFNGVTDILARGKTFSGTPAFSEFRNYLQAKVLDGSVPKVEAAQLMKTLTSDKLAVSEGKVNLRTKEQLLKDYAQNVDNAIRQWGKPLEKGGQTGAAAVDANTSAEVRQNLRSVYNDFLENKGLGSLEQKYRQAYSQEKLAEAKDNFQKLLFGHVSSTEQASYIRNLQKAGDQEALDVVKKGLTTHLANVPAKDVFKEFGKIETMLAQTKLVEPKRIVELQRAAKQISDMAEGKAKEKLMQNWKRAALQAASIEAGAEIGKKSQAEE